MITMMTAKDDDKSDEQKAQVNQRTSISRESRTSQEFKNQEEFKTQEESLQSRIKISIKKFFQNFE